ncbi:MAG: potassium transporter Kup [Sterolibacteriaceae bacterium]|uniref:Probable potassium transport system protein Kup n=1 Tax=Candidatus Methylophosphatis roskildensis TaxID=2899263 RepID=A0A9D7E5G7_9PROT|nr:potassium transporter Kup [Candidatus Methylophosphatis roskildensis]
MSQPTGKRNISTLILGAVGVVYGDIGTSPLYAMKETFAGHHPLAVVEGNILGVLSVMFWTIMVLVSVKYVAVIMRADNRGEGGSLALLALVSDLTRNNKRLRWVITLLGVFAAALFFGDSMITPAISVLSAVEGLNVVAPRFSEFVVPISAVVLTGLFFIQKHGTGVVGLAFGPIMVAWFGILALLGIQSIAHTPHVLAALNPAFAFHFISADFHRAFFALGSVVLAVTGGEALYTDMGHFGKFPIRVTWFGFVLPALVLNYFGQGALLLQDPTAIENPFFLLAPEWGQMPMVLLATAATVIASQAVISGAFSVARQSVQMGFLPRMEIKQTSDRERGQIYVPFTNWTLYLAVMGLVIGFGSSSNLAAAYGIAVTGTMTIDTILIAFVIVLAWRWTLPLAVLAVGGFLIIDLAYFFANAIKIPQGGWFPLAMGLISFTVLTTWRRGRRLLFNEMKRQKVPLQALIDGYEDCPNRAFGTAVFMTSVGEGVPSAMLHNLKHNQVMHERNVLLTVITDDHPYVPAAERITITDLGKDFYRVVVHYGFMQEPNVPAALELCAEHGLKFDMMSTSFFVSRETVIPSLTPGMALWRERLFCALSRNAMSATDFFKIPTNRVVEMGTQIEI